MVKSVGMMDLKVNNLEIVHLQMAHMVTLDLKFDQVKTVRHTQDSYQMHH